MPEPSEFGALPAAGMILFNILLQVSMEERDLLLPRLSRPGGCQKVSGFVSWSSPLPGALGPASSWCAEQGLQGGVLQSRNLALEHPLPFVGLEFGSAQT